MGNAGLASWKTRRHAGISRKNSSHFYSKTQKKPRRQKHPNFNTSDRCSAAQLLEARFLSTKIGGMPGASTRTAALIAQHSSTPHNPSTQHGHHRAEQACGLGSVRQSARGGTTVCVRNAGGLQTHSAVRFFHAQSFLDLVLQFSHHRFVSGVCTVLRSH